MAQQAPSVAPYTYRDYRSWHDAEPCELIDGRPLAIAPAPGLAHQTLVVELSTQIALHLRGRPCRVFTAPFDVRLPRAGEADDETRDVVQPDILVVCDPGRLDEQGCRGAPDWIIEVLSSRTAARDHIDKRLLYERSGVREYWLVHPSDRIVTVYRLEQGRFGPADIQAARGSLASTAVADLTIDWELAFHRL